MHTLLGQVGTIVNAEIYMLAGWSRAREGEGESKKSHSMKAGSIVKVNVEVHLVHILSLHFAQRIPLHTTDIHSRRFSGPNMSMKSFASRKLKWASLSLFRWELLIRVFISTTHIVFAYFFVVV